MVSAITFTVAPANAGVYVFACFRINVPRKGFIPLLATGAAVTGIHSLVWFKYVFMFVHFQPFSVTGVTLVTGCYRCYSVLQSFKILLTFMCEILSSAPISRRLRHCRFSSITFSIRFSLSFSVCCFRCSHSLPKFTNSNSKKLRGLSI